MPTHRNFQNPIHQEENTPLVTITETHLDTKQSVALDSRGVKYVIDLTKASFGGIIYPKPSTQWYLKKISGVWALMARASQQNPQLGTTLTPAVGQTYIGNEGDTHVVGNLVVGGTVTSAGSGTPDSDIGVIRAWTTSTPPTGNLLCDGSAVSRTTYSLLFGVIGTTYGAGDGSTTFNVPNLKGKVVVGFDAGETEFNTLGGTGGEKYHALLLAELASHNHTVGAVTVGNQSVDHTHSVSITTSTESTTHTHTIGADNDTASGSFGYSVHRGAGSGAVQSNVSTGQSVNHTHSVSGSTAGTSATHNHALSGNTDSTGSGTAHNNIQPYMTLYYVIKALSTGSGGGGGGGGGSDTDSLASLTDVALSSPVATNLLGFNGTKWTNVAAPAGSLAGLTDVTIASAANKNVLEFNGTVWVNRPDIALSEASAATAAISIQVNGDSQQRFIVGADGKQNWGTGAAATDTNLYRNAVGQLAADGSAGILLTTVGAQFNTGGSTSLASFASIRAATTDNVISGRVSGDTQSRWVVQSGGTMQWGPGGSTAVDTNLYRGSAGQLQTDYTFGVNAAAAANTALAVFVTGDTFDRFRILGDGTHAWGPGNAARDVNLYRSAVGVLKTDNSLTVGSAFTVGTVQVDPSSPATANVLRYNGTKYVSAALAEGDITNLTTDLAGKQPLATITTKGDLYAGTGSATTTRQAVGTDNQVLVADSTQTTGLRWANSPGGTPVATRMLSNALQSIGTGTITAVSFTSTVFDTNISWSVGNPTRFTAKIAGYYLCNANITWPANSAGTQRTLIWAVNGSSQNGTDNAFPPNTQAIVQAASPLVVFLNVNDYVEITCYQDTGSSINIGNNSYAPAYNSMSINLVGSSTTANGPTMRAGTIVQFAGASAPSGWVFCDGTSYLRTTYPDLFNAIGTTYGSVDGTHFTVPNLNGRVALGVGASSAPGATSHALASTGGEETHTMTTAELVAHQHKIGMRNDGSTVSNNLQMATTGNTFAFHSSGIGGNQTGGGGDGLSYATTGGGTPFNELPPYLTLNFIIKTNDSSDIINGSVTNAKLAWDIFTTKGDIVAATGPSAASRLGVGANKQQLIADSTQATGIKWGLPALGDQSNVVITSPASGDLVRYNGSNFVNVPEETNAQYPNALGVQVTPSFTTSSTTYVNITNATMTFTKNKAGTRLRCSFATGWFDTATGTSIWWAVNVNSTDYLMAQLIANTLASTYQQASGFVYITGVPAGTYTINARVKATGGTVGMDGNAIFNLEVMECH